MYKWLPKRFLTFIVRLTQQMANRILLNMKYSSSNKLRLYPQQQSANLTNTKYPVLPFVIEKLLDWGLSAQDWTLMWTDLSVSIDQVKPLKKNQCINHFPGMFELSRKNRLARNLNSLRKQFPEQYDFYPETWVLPLQFTQLQQFHNENPSTTYIVKPQAGCQGRGIYLTNSISQLQKSRGHIVQRYIANPYLIDNLKFDFRIYVLVTCVNPLRIYVFDQGLARFATEEFSPPDAMNLKRTFTHLTNYSINKENSNFKSSQEDFSVGHKRSLKGLLLKINQPGLHQRIYDVIVKTMIAGQAELSSHYKSAQPHNINCCFEVLGFDIILDSQLKPYLLQINHTPSFNVDTSLDRKVKVDLITNTIKLVCRDNSDCWMEEETSRKHKYEYMSSILDYQLKEKDRHQMRNIGRFTRVFPSNEDDTIYQPFFKAGNQLFHKKYGTNIIRRKKRIYQQEQQPVFVPRLNVHSQLQKVYKKNPLKPFRNIRIQVQRRIADTAQNSEAEFRKRSCLRQRTAEIYSNKTTMHNFRSSSSNLGY